MKNLLEKFSFRRVILALADAFIIMSSALIANFILSFFNSEISRSDMLMSFVVSSVTCCGSLFIFGAYSKLWRFFHKRDYLSCAYGVIGGIIIACGFIYIIRKNVNINYACVHGLISLIGVCLFRFLFKETFVTFSDSVTKSGKKRTMIVGGGQTCRMILTEIKNATESSFTDDKVSAAYDPVCIIDDDRSKIGSEILGVTVVGTTNEIIKFVDQQHIEQIIFAIPSCLEDERKRILDICSCTKLPVKVVPFIGNLIFDNGNTPILTQMRDIKVEDLLGRSPIKFDNEEIRHFIYGKVCMVTGGGGSIGSELVRQIAKYGPQQIIIVDIYENNAYAIQQELVMDYGDSLNLTVLIASVRDYYRMNRIFEKYKPDIVFHAAAHKHVPLMENSPMEAIKNNVIGTFNTASLAQFHKVKKFVMVSTDKAVNPTNVMGASKRCCEMIIQYLSQQRDCYTEFVTTRFGNVLGSNGSVIPLFRKQIEQGKPVTVTHPDVIRYFMTIPEAVSLVLEAAAIAHGGEIFVLDMGQPVHIVKLAENLIRMYGKEPYKDVEIKFTGLRPGEKLREELLMNEEGLRKTSNELIFIGQQIELDGEEFIKKLRRLRNAANENLCDLVVEQLHEIVPTFITPEEFNRAEIIKHSKTEFVENVRD
ncbi:NDP-sugar epimerase, includes UDP-GlcNAc-inverting 4,6-dehydratase FlaA1 and capsular polysaccharide biosynthesis protein EpsC [Ruminococcus flavefaciens]|uniref:NDP-sugar epimerase, includes UDP-GlcNAc-inverting 4,6-dehydratase FlaA1 and capsular polysaccharide biosynthesis protein EpsC n=1 Tax=Ruminococcus flavefaciens TaxID=1265 RepID=A0A1H6KR74_RUMFL|nr:nucleoside-diphosphate sugar epimerase/dehydratase [Ruminococcus flavefaciens]SEH78004.1 NDP-sugar epimerase, includes UDP-GlcNAc-inverting 4,6-dehydratase FlaA1 and capsular polysaccharide biosynthesis protein EpsC [Ruminococcus flavefaciens]